MNKYETIFGDISNEKVFTVTGTLVRAIFPKMIKPKETTKTESVSVSLQKLPNPKKNSFIFIHESKISRNRKCNNQLYDFLGTILELGEDYIC